MLYVYLNGKKLTALPDFNEEVVHDRDRESSKRFRLGGKSISCDAGGFYVILSEPSDRLDEALKDLVDHVTYHTSIPVIPRREAGTYTLKKDVKPVESADKPIEAVVESAKEVTAASAVLEAPSKSETVYLVMIGNSVEDVAKLHHQIRTGAIRPDESYEGPQGGMSRAELENELNQAQDINLSLMRKVTALEDERVKQDKRIDLMDSKMKKIWHLAFALRCTRRWWPFYYGNGVSNKIVSIVNTD